MPKLSRRNFLQGSTVCMGLLGLNSLAGTAHATNIPQWDEEFEVIVVGSGMGGMVGAVSAKLNGCNKVVVIEKMPVPGGNSVIAAGDICAVNSSLSKEQKIVDSVELFVDDFTKAGDARNHKELTRAVAENSGRGIDFLLQHGAKFHEKLIKHFGHSANRIHQPVGGCANGVIAPLRTQFLGKYAGELRYRVKMDEIVTDDSGRVIGLKVREHYDFNPRLLSDDLENTSGKVKYYRATKGVLMAYGGYARDVVFRKEDFSLFNPLMVQTSSLGSTGGGIRAMLQIGARPFGLSFMRYGFDLAGGDTRFACLVHPKTGKRYINEALPRPPLAQSALEVAANSEGIFPVAIFDSDNVASFEDAIRTKRLLRLGHLRSYPNIADLATGEGLPGDVVEATLKQYNANISTGKDPDFGKDVAKSKALPIVTSPFYASSFIPRASNTVGGILVTPKAEVMSIVNSKPIPGLYAAGECASGMHGAASLPSASLVVGLTFGLLAGEELAKQFGKA